MDVADLMDEKPNEHDPFGLLMTVDGPTEESVWAPVGAPSGQKHPVETVVATTKSRIPTGLGTRFTSREARSS